MMGRNAAAVVLLIFVGAAVGAGADSLLGTDFRPCVSSKKYAVTIKDVIIDPYPVVSGDFVTFTIPAYASTELAGGTVVVSVSLYGFKVHTERDDLCAKSKCPVNGDFALQSSQALPPFTPPGKYKLKFQVLDSNGKEQGCASVNFDIVWRAKQLLDKAASSVNNEIGEAATDLALS